MKVSSQIINPSLQAEWEEDVDLDADPLSLSDLDAALAEVLLSIGDFSPTVVGKGGWIDMGGSDGTLSLIELS